MMLTNVLTGVQFILLNQTATTYLIAVSLIYSVLLMMESKFPVVRTHGFTALVITLQTVGYVVINGLAWNWGLLALTGTVMATVAMWFQEPIKLKVTMLIMGFVWFTFQIVSGAYGQLPGEVVFLAGITVSIMMLMKAKKQGIPLDEVEELPILIRNKFLAKKIPKNAELAFS